MNVFFILLLMFASLNCFIPAVLIKFQISWAPPVSFTQPRMRIGYFHENCHSPKNAFSQKRP